MEVAAIEHSCESDGDHSSSVDQWSPVNDFLTHHLDEIIDISYGFREHFSSFNPFFLQYMESTDLTHFYLHHCIEKQKDYLVKKKVNSASTIYKAFLAECTNEVGWSYKTIASLGKTLSKFGPPSFSDWCKFCFYYSHIDETMLSSFDTF